MIHPTDYRYKVDALEDYLSPNALLRYQIRVEIAYIAALAKLDVCSQSVLEEYTKAEGAVTHERVSQLESELKHDVRAMVEAMKEQVSPSARPYCHLGLTSNDIIANATALLIREVCINLLQPSLTELLTILIKKAKQHSSLVQMGRTHGQHAEPTTFGFVLANYIERIGRGLIRIKQAQAGLRGKIGGAVGTRAGLKLIADPQKLEAETLAKLGLVSVEAPSQLANQEELANFFSQLILVLGTIADMANDFRQLQRTEIAEVFEATEETQVGSSTMPQKRNPIGWENIVSHYKSIVPKLVTSYMNLISEHQRDLTDSAANRYLLAEILNTFLYCVRRAKFLLQNIEVNEERMRENIALNRSFELAEPAYILLALSGVDDAHRVIRNIVREAHQRDLSFKEMLQQNESLIRSIDSVSKEKKHAIKDSYDYIGQASEITESVCAVWEDYLREV
ncbi:MAG: lyase family protein [Candidatus Thorarchaeota archaeon]